MTRQAWSLRAVEGEMANIDFREADLDVDHVRQLARQAGHIQRAQKMLAAAGLTAIGMIAIAAAMLTTIA